MKALPITWNNIPDSTGYLHTLAKSVVAVLYHSTLPESPIDPTDIITASGFAHRMWIAPDLCPSAASIWDFSAQSAWFANAGVICDYVGRLWDEGALEEERRHAAIVQIRDGIDHGIASAVWDIGGCEWSVIRGYDDTAFQFEILTLDGGTKTLPYEKLGQLDIPILSVLTPSHYEPKSEDVLVRDTIRLAASHLRGEEWCGTNASGLAAYPALIACVESGDFDASWNLDYNLGTYAALKFHAAAFYKKHHACSVCPSLAEEYRIAADAWNHAYRCKISDMALTEKRRVIADDLRTAEAAEMRALAVMESVFA